MFSREEFSKRIKQLRFNKNIKQTELAEFLGVTPTQISDLENAKTTTTIERLCLLADYFDVTTDYLVGRNPKKELS